MRINTNLMALNAQNMLAGNQSAVQKSINKLSSGLRINSAADIGCICIGSRCIKCSII